MSDPRDPDPTTIAAPVEFTVDLGAFLPETSTIGSADDAEHQPDQDEAEDGLDDVEDLGPDGAATVEATEGVPDAGATGEAVEDVPDAATVAAPAEAREPVDVAVLAGIEADLAAVDQALEAIDAGEPGRSPLLTELLADPPPA